MEAKEILDNLVAEGIYGKNEEEVRATLAENDFDVEDLPDLWKLGEKPLEEGE